MRVHDARYWKLVLLHHLIAHPLLVVAEIADEIGTPSAVKLARNLYRFHDRTVPDEEP